MKECEIRFGEDTLNVAIVNGFRNIRNIVQKFKRSRCQFDYVEIMACPSGKSPSINFLRVCRVNSLSVLQFSGCINGSAQIKSTTNSNAKELIARLEEGYQNLPNNKDIIDYQEKLKIYGNWLKTVFGEDIPESTLRTSYQSLQQNNSGSLNIKW